MYIVLSDHQRRRFVAPGHPGGEGPGQLELAHVLDGDLIRPL